jgi:hypothetical protein
LNYRPDPWKTRKAKSITFARALVWTDSEAPVNSTAVTVPQNQCMKICRPRARKLRRLAGAALSRPLAAAPSSHCHHRAAKSSDHKSADCCLQTSGGSAGGRCDCKQSGGPFLHAAAYNAADVKDARAPNVFDYNEAVRAVAYLSIQKWPRTIFGFRREGV